MVRHPLAVLNWIARLCLFCLAALGVPAMAAAGAPSVFLEDLTSVELRAAVASGSTTVLVPIGGTEQNGPHMALGKHNLRVKVLAGQIAQRLGNAIVAPVIAYVPEGAIFPPVAHMRFSGTISISDATFEALLESTARSFKQHGFHDVVFLGDHGGYQKSEVRAAEKINKEWAADGRSRALALTAYYEASQVPYIQALRERGFSDAEIGTHAGLADTSLMLAIDKSLVRMDLLAQGAKATPAEGVYGDPRKSSSELGQLGIRSIVEHSVRAIQDAVKQHASR
jgi:creatinine amidohydrolase/Fe(II)-dependent formamide hydrolase-like protein